MKIIIDGEPIADSRPRIKRREKLSWAYDPKASKKKDIKNQILGLVKETCKDAPNLAQDKPISMTLCFHMSPLKKDLSSEKKRKIAFTRKATIKPDIDNLIKFILDCCNGILFSDDKNIVSLEAHKKYDPNPRTEISIT